MSIRTVPLSTTYYLPPQAIQQYTSPIKQTINLRNYSSPLQSGDTLTLSHYYDAKGDIEVRYQQDLENWRSKALDAEYRKDLLEQENTRLLSELQYWKTKNFSTEREQALELEIKKQMTSSQIHTLQKTAGSQQEVLYVQIDTLRDQLHQKMREVDEQRKIYFDNEIKTQNAHSETETKLKAQEAQLKIFVRDLQEKIDQADALHQDNAALQIQASKLGPIQREVQEINNLLEYNYEESEKLRLELTKNQSENFQLRKNELVLKEQEENLMRQIDQMQSKIRQTHELRDSEVERVNRSHIEWLENLKQDHFKVKQALELKKLTYSQLISEKEKNVKEFSDNLENIKERIGRTKYRGSSAKKEADDWRLRQKSIDQERDQEVNRIHQERDKSVEALKRSHTFDKNQLEDRISLLRNDLDTKEELLKQTNINLNKTRYEKSNLEVERQRLLAEVELKRQAELEQERQHHLHLSEKERAYQLAQNNLRSSSHYERSRLQDQEKVLSSVLGEKQKEVLEQQERATRYRVGAYDAEQKQRERSIEADAWKSNYSRTEREKSLEIDTIRSLRQSQIDIMNQSHNAEILAEERNKSTLIGVLGSKQNEVRQLLDSNNNLVGEVIVTQHEAKRAGLEAQAWRSRAEIEQRQKQQQLLQQEISQQSELGSLHRSQLNQNLYLRNEVNNLLSSIEIKQNEEVNWRENYTNLLGRR